MRALSRITKLGVVILAVAGVSVAAVAEEAREPQGPPGAGSASAPPPGSAAPVASVAPEVTTDRGSPGVVHTGCDAEGGAGVPRCGAALVFGMVPDGVEDVAVRLSSGTVEAGRVAGNAYLVDVPGDPVRVEYETSAGTVRQVAP